MKWLTWIIVLAVLGGGGWFAWKKYGDKSKAGALDYKTAVVTSGDITQAVTANGQITPVKNVAIGCQISGIITNIYVDFNSQVTNGQVIAQIDGSTYQQSITQAEAELANAQAALEYAQVNYKRSKDLRTAELISPADYDKTVADLHQAEAVVKTREASLNKAKVDLERTTIYAPISGIVISRNVDIGQTVAASFSTPTLFQIANDLHNMRIEAMVSEADVGGVEVKQKVNFTVDAFPNRTFHGDVTQVRFAPITNQNVVNYTSIIDVNNADLKLRPGMTANASIVIAEKKGVLKVPTSALRFRPPEPSTNKTSSASAVKGTNSVASAPAPGGPGGGGEGRPNRDEMRKRMEAMSPEEREQARARWRERGGGGPDGGNRAASDGPITRTLYLAHKQADGHFDLSPVKVKLGITDNSFSEVIDGLKEGDVVATGINVAPGASTGANAAPGRSPFGGSPFGGGPRR